MEATKALERLKRKLTIENLWMYVIKVLKDKGELRAYDIKKELASNFRIRPATITVYVVIYKMCEEGLIESVKSVNDTRYRVTEKGIQVFNDGLRFLSEVIDKLSG